MTSARSGVTTRALYFRGCVKQVIDRAYFIPVNRSLLSPLPGRPGQLCASHREVISSSSAVPSPRGPHRNNIELGRFGRNRTNVWNYPGANSFGRAGEEGNLLALHPTVKPIAMIADAIMDCTARGDIVLDGFLGSGTTVIAAERTGRRCYGLELDPLYVDTVVRRWQAYTSADATHASTGRCFNDLELERKGQNAG
jgi:hypothetical protein